MLGIIFNSLKISLKIHWENIKKKQSRQNWIKMINIMSLTDLLFILLKRYNDYKHICTQKYHFEIYKTPKPACGNRIIKNYGSLF